MRLDELTFPKDIDAAAEILQKFDYQQLGNRSSFGKVFYKDGEKSVLKLYDRNDLGYTKFIDLCRTHNNPHFPKFSRSSVAIKGTCYRAVKTEILVEGDRDDLVEIAEFFSAFINNYQYYWTKYENDCKEYLNKDRAMSEAFELLKITFATDPTVRFDLHSQNMMMRGDTVVIIDPVAPA